MFAIHQAREVSRKSDQVFFLQLDYNSDKITIHSSTIASSFIQISKSVQTSKGETLKFRAAELKGFSGTQIKERNCFDESI